MTGEELKWAFLHGVPVRIINKVAGTDFWCKELHEIVYGRDEHGGVRVSAVCITRAGPAPSLLRARSTDVIFARERDAERCAMEISDTQSEAVS